MFVKDLFRVLWGQSLNCKNTVKTRQTYCRIKGLIFLENTQERSMDNNLHLTGVSFQHAKINP